MIRVVLVEDQMLVRRGIKTLLEMGRDIVVVADVGSADEGVAAIREHDPDVVLLDVRMPGKNGIELLQELGGSEELPPTILLTTFDDDEALIDGMKAGRGLLLRVISLRLLTDAIRRVAAGETAARDYAAFVARIPPSYRYVDNFRPEFAFTSSSIV